VDAREVVLRRLAATGLTGPLPVAEQVVDHLLVGLRERPYMGVVLVDGVVAGSWGRTATASGVTVRVTPLEAPLHGAGLQAAADAYGDFLALPATVVLEG
jgi:hypothetical protein